jgi:hypothetical protein
VQIGGGNLHSHDRGRGSRKSLTSRVAGDMLAPYR